MGGFVFDLVDAAGSGAAEIRDDGTIANASAGFARLAGHDAVVDVMGAPVVTLLPMLPPLDKLPPRVDASAPVFVQTSADGRSQALSAAIVRAGDDGVRFLILVDRSRQAALRGPQPAGTQATHALQPRRGGVRTQEDLTARIERALAHARTHAESVTVVALRIGDTPDDLDLDGVILGCIRGVDDVARASRGHYLLLMPDTDARTSAGVAKRIASRIQGYGLLSVGIAESFSGCDADTMLGRADEACERSRQRGGGVVLADRPA